LFKMPRHFPIHAGIKHPSIEEKCLEHREGRGRKGGNREGGEEKGEEGEGHGDAGGKQIVTRDVELEAGDKNIWFQEFCDNDECEDENDDDDDDFFMGKVNLWRGEDKEWKRVGRSGETVEEGEDCGAGSGDATGSGRRRLRTRSTTISCLFKSADLDRVFNNFTFVFLFVALFFVSFASAGENMLDQEYAEMKGGNGLSLAKRLVGGEAAPGPQAWPWQVSLSWKFDLGDFQRLIHMCGAALISSKWLLTAAHCFRKYNKPDQWVARLGEYNLFKEDGTEMVIQVKRLISHPKFDHGAGYDIALVELVDEVKSTSSLRRFPQRSLPETFVRPVHIPESTSSNYEESENCFITGWGETRSDAPRRVLNQVGGKIWKTKECEDLWGFRVNRHRQICFGNGEYGPCLGDSGGPLVCFPSTVESKRDLATNQIRSTENTTTAAAAAATATAATSATKGPLEEAVLVGVVSFGTQTCDKKGWPGVFTSVTYHSEWIRQYL